MDNKLTDKELEILKAMDALRNLRNSLQALLAGFGDSPELEAYRDYIRKIEFPTTIGGYDTKSLWLKRQDSIMSDIATSYIRD